MVHWQLKTIRQFNVLQTHFSISGWLYISCFVGFGIDKIVLLLDDISKNSFASMNFVRWIWP
jgi:hypothetical protein